MTTRSPKLLSLFALLLAIVGFNAAGCTTTGSTRSAANDQSTLDVYVNVPPTWRPFVQEDIARAFTYRVGEVFRRRGYQGKVGQAYSPGDQREGVPFLTINLIEWRVDRTGNVQCTFSADIAASGTTKHLGLFQESALSWINGTTRWGLRDSFDDAAEGAIRQLYEDLAKTELVPGLRMD